MKKKKSDNLIKGLINNQISREGFEALLEGLDEEDTIRFYEIYLECHFNQILDEYTKMKEEGK